MNPHISLTLEIGGEQGEPVRQEVEGGSISTLSPLGLTRDSLTVGERVTVRARPHRGGSGRPVLGIDATRGDGSTFPLIVGAQSDCFEDGALVVDTVGFAVHREGLGFGLPSGLRKHLVERLALDADGRHLSYEIMAEDPEYLTGPIHAAAKWEYSPDLELSGAECDLESARRFLQEQ